MSLTDQQIEAAAIIGAGESTGDFIAGAHWAIAALASLSTSKQAGTEPLVSREHDIALREGHQIRASEDYFCARSKDFHTINTVSAYEAGFKKGWEDRADLAAPGAAIAAREQEADWPKLDKPAQVDCSFGVGVSTRLVVEAAQRRYERESANRVKTLADALNDPRPLHEQIAEIRQQERPTAEVLNTMVGASRNEAPATPQAAIPAAPSEALTAAELRGKLLAAANYIDVLGGDSKNFRASLAALTQPTTVQQAPQSDAVKVLRDILAESCDPDGESYVSDELYRRGVAALKTAQTTALPGGDGEGEL